MLDCKKVQPQLSEFVDGALDGDAAWSIKLHLATCAVCAKVEEELRGTADLLRSLPEIGPSASFEAKLAARLADQVLQPRRPSLADRLRDWWYDAPYARPAVTTSALALVALIPLVFFTINRAPVGDAPLVGAPRGSTAVAKAPANTTTLEQVWAEHTSSDPFGDDSSLLLTSAPTDSSATAVGMPAPDDRQPL